MEPRGEGFLLSETLTTKSFCSLTGDREVQQKTSNFDYVMEVQEGKQAVFIDTSDEKNSGMARFINDKDRTVGVNCRMKKVTDDQGRNHCIFLATRPIQSG